MQPCEPLLPEDSFPQDPDTAAQNCTVLTFTCGGSGANMLPQLEARLKQQLSRDGSHPQTRFLCIDPEDSQPSAQSAERQSP